MKYQDLIQFEPVERDIKLREADDLGKAEELVSTYVISDRMADVMLHQIVPSLDLSKPDDGAGLFVVGNYGTGKSHLMSVVSAVAEHSDLLNYLTNPIVIDGFAPIAGKFKVIRQEFGATKMDLRDIVVNYIEQGLDEMGVQFKFPSMDETPNTKEPLLQMMAAFHAKYPDHGLLVMVDELLDYLRHRKERELILDLNFLREVGEICEQTRLRFVAGLQESLFDNPKFAFAAESIRRVKDRYEQVRIVRADVQYVVSRRLLAKTQKQRAWIREHLERFTPLYESMAENLDAFVELFPVHPAYLEMFEQVSVIEKRQVLLALSREMRKRLELEIPDNEPGLISFDAYWEMIQDDVSYRSIPEIRVVQEKSRVLHDRAINALAIDSYKPAAARLINALALHRVSVGDLNAPIGMSAKELRDRLCLYVPIPEQDTDFLLVTVEAVLTEISKVMGGRFISLNRENGQYYLNLVDAPDYFALIEQKADTLDHDSFDRYYFEMLSRALELTDSTYVPSFRIWQRDLPWLGKGMTRQGYIFLGASNERSTAQPPRDFYLHFLALYTTNEKDSIGEADEVFFSLDKRDGEFDNDLRLYAGAREMGAISSTPHREQYERLGDKHLRNMVNWLRENFMRAFELRYQDNQQTPTEVVSSHRLSIRDLTFRDQIFHLASASLGGYFQSRYPDYPTFSTVTFTFDTLAQGADAALRAIAGKSVTRPAESVLEALKLATREGNQLTYTLDQSPYAEGVQERLNAQPSGKVLNRSDLVQGAMDVEKDNLFGLEIEWLVVVLLALVRQGKITLNLPGRKIDSDDLEDAASLGVETLCKFTSIGRPKSLPEQALKVLFVGLDLPEGWVTDATKHEFAVKELQRKVEGELNQVVLAQEWLREGLRYWREPVLPPVEKDEWREGLEAYKNFLDSLQNLTTPGKLNNFQYPIDEVAKLLEARDILGHVVKLNEMLLGLQPHLEYIYQAELSLPSEDAWQDEAMQTRAGDLELLQDPAQRTTHQARNRLNGGLGNLRSSYAQVYITRHKAARLNTSQDTRKKNLSQDVRWGQLKALSSLDLLPEKELGKFEKDFTELRSCPGIGTSDLQHHTTCQICNFNPRMEEQLGTASQRLIDIEGGFEELYQRWTKTLQENLQDPSVQENIQLLVTRERNQVGAFLQSGELPEKITYQFIDALKDCLHGLEKVVVDSGDFMLALTKAGMPCTPEELETRFRKFIAEKIKGKDPTKVRIQIDW